MTGNGAITGDLVNHGTVTCNGPLSVTGAVTNNGTMRLTGGAALSVSGGLINNGTLDLMTGAQALPANFVNNGIVLDSGMVRASSVSRSGASVTVTIQGYTGHSYRLERSPSLSSPDWIALGTALTPSINNQTLTFTDSAASGTESFYRILVTP